MDMMCVSTILNDNNFLISNGTIIKFSCQSRIEWCKNFMVNPFKLRKLLVFQVIKKYTEIQST